MIVSLDEMKQYLRVDYPDDDQFISDLITASESLCMCVARCSDPEAFVANQKSKVAVMYAVAYLYEHREDANHNDLAITLRALLSDMREGGF